MALIFLYPPHFVSAAESSNLSKLWLTLPITTT